MTTDSTSNRLVQMADERRRTLKLLAKSANLSHRWAAAAAGAAINHMVGAGHALVQARDLCEEGGWLRWGLYMRFRRGFLAHHLLHHPHKADGVGQSATSKLAIRVWR